ncbi:uncharacterized protein LOC121568855 [Coregonus clupeaformis]|uniref:uncharacterized protein LOC121568855 n=1 Tax=Coregonus clupeaformis TaxID=59861 RepID=UPI001BE00860|nr:uncharacterized protein LOC121568855 [Coregonus clupeaformis]
MSFSSLFGLLLTNLLLIQGCWGEEETKNVSCASLQTGNTYKYCVDEKEKPKCVEWESVDSNNELCQHKKTTPAPNVIDVNYSCITLPECVNVNHIAISGLTNQEHWTNIIVSGASDEPKKPLEKSPEWQNKTTDNVKQDADQKNQDHNNTHPWLIPVVIAVAIIILMLGVGWIVYKKLKKGFPSQTNNDIEMNNMGTDSTNDHTDDLPPDAETLVQPQTNGQVLSDRDQGEEGVLGVEDGKPSDNDQADTESCQKTHADSPPLNVPKVVRESHLTDGAPGQGAGETSPLLCRSPGEEAVLEGEDRKPADSGGTDPESCQKTHAEPPDIRVNDKTKEPTPNAQSPGPPQMNGRPPMSNRVAEETTALLDKQALDKDKVRKPELIDKGHNDIESRRGEL